MWCLHFWASCLLVFALGFAAEAQTIMPLPDTIGKTSATKTGGLSQIDKAYRIKGVVRDEANGESLPFATIVFTGTSVGTSADINGKFEMSFKELPAPVLKLQALGYEPIYYVLDDTQHTYSLEFEMKRSSSELSEFTIQAKGVDPALLLVKRIIKHKAQNDPERLENYRCEAYTRMELDMKNVNESSLSGYPIFNQYKFAINNNIDSTSEKIPFLPVYLTETISDYLFENHPHREKEIIKSSMARGVKNYDLTRYTGATYPRVNVYKNTIPVLDKKFVSPISNEGPLFYRYHIRDTERAYGHNIILVEFSPRREGELCFSGDFWVVDSVYAIQRVSMDVPKSVNLNWFDNINLYEEFAPTEDGHWFWSKDKTIVGLSAYGTKKVIGLIVRKTTNYHHIKINDTTVTDLLDSTGATNFIAQKDSANSYSEDWWNKNRPDSLTHNEQVIAKTVDTILSMPVTKHYINFISLLASGVKDVGWIELGPYWYVYSNNPHEGDRVRLSIGTPRKLENLHLATYLAYGFKDRAFKSGFEENWVINRKPWTTLNSQVIYDLAQGMNNFNREVQTDNIFANLLRKGDITWKQAFLNSQKVEFFRQFYSGFSFAVTLLNELYKPYAPLPSVGIFTDANGHPADNVRAFETKLYLRYAYKENYVNSKYKRQRLGTRYPVFDLGLTKGMKNVMESAYDYTKADFSVQQTINITPFGHIEYRIMAGEYFGKLPYPLLQIHPGNEYYYYEPNSFEMMNNYEFISDKFAAFRIEHDLGGGLFNLVPAIKKLKFRQLWTAKGVIGSLSPENSALNLNKNYPFRTLAGNPYLELGTGIANILRLIRLDFVWRVMPKPLPTEQRNAYFGVFGSVQVIF